jgi:hypothetical protein
MKQLIVILQTAVFVGIASLACAQSLADLANKEKERREEIENGTKVITNAEVANYRNGAVTTGPAITAASTETDIENGDEGQSSSTEADSDEPVDFEGRPESFWRTTMDEARRKVKELENRADVIVLKLTDLQTQFYSIDDGFKREEIQREINKAFYEQDQNKKNLAEAMDQLRDLEKEARKSGALPGWIEP